MSGVRILIFTLAAFALLCLAGFWLLDADDAPAPPSARTAPSRPLPDVQAPMVMPPVLEPTVSSEALPAAAVAPEPVTDIQVREPELPEAVEPADAREPTWSDDVITAPGTRWIQETEREARRLLSLCMATDGEQVEEAVEISIELIFTPDTRDAPTERRAVVSIQDPYLQACASDSLLDLEYPDPGGPADFTHRASFTWSAP